jgi:hypothetical protein
MNRIGFTSGAAVAVALTLALGLAGCDPEIPTSAPVEKGEPASHASASRIVLQAGGLGVTDAAGVKRDLPFGTPKLEALAALTGAHEGVAGMQSANGECGAGPLTFAAWDDGLSVAFDGAEFAGWTLGNSGAVTAQGIGVGSSREALNALHPEIRESSLGTEFVANDIGGLLDGPSLDAHVTSLWAGVTCMFR